MPLLSHPNEEIVYKVLALLKVLLECGNKTVQAGLASLISAKEHTLFPTLQRMLKQSAVACGERYHGILHGSVILLLTMVLNPTVFSSLQSIFDSENEGSDYY